MNIAVVLTTYNRPDALAAVLEGYQAQTEQHFEILIADDGSTNDTRAVIESYAACSPFPIRHVWQADEGFRAAAARNRALAATKADYIIFTDGDCVPRTDFVAQHAKLASPGQFLSGNRILLSEGLTQLVLEKQLRLHEYSKLYWLRAKLNGDINRWLPMLSFPDGTWRSAEPNRWDGVKTCNLSAWRSDLLRINGFDESYSGWGLEDSDLVIRLLHAGVKQKSARFATAVLHLWHREWDRGRLPENQRRLAELLASRRFEALLGLDRHA